MSPAAVAPIRWTSISAARCAIRTPRVKVLQLPDREGSNQTTREMTVKMTPAGSEAPTVEQPALRRLDEPTIREKVEAPCAAS